MSILEKIGLRDTVEQQREKQEQLNRDIEHARRQQVEAKNRNKNMVEQDVKDFRNAVSKINKSKAGKVFENTTRHIEKEAKSIRKTKVRTSGRIPKMYSSNREYGLGSMGIFDGIREEKQPKNNYFGNLDYLGIEAFSGDKKTKGKKSKDDYARDIIGIF